MRSRTNILFCARSRSMSRCGPLEPCRALLLPEAGGERAVVRGVGAEFVAERVSSRVSMRRIVIAFTSGASVTSAAARSNVWPSRTCTVAITPSRGALMAVSSFMLSITSSVSPRRDRLAFADDSDDDCRASAPRRRRRRAMRRRARRAARRVLGSAARSAWPSRWTWT